MGSNPTHLTPAFSHEVQAGRFWSQRFFRSLQRLQADTLRKEEVAVELRGAEVVLKVELLEANEGWVG